MSRQRLIFGAVDGSLFLYCMVSKCIRNTLLQTSMFFSSKPHFYNQMNLTPVILLQMWHKTIYEWLLSTENINVAHLNVKLFFFSIRNHIFQRRIIGRKKIFFLGTNQEHTPHFFYHFFSETNWSMTHSCFVCKYDNFVCAGNWLIFFFEFR